MPRCFPNSKSTLGDTARTLPWLLMLCCHLMGTATLTTRCLPRPNTTDTASARRSCTYGSSQCTRSMALYSVWMMAALVALAVVVTHDTARHCSSSTPTGSSQHLIRPLQYDRRCTVCDRGGQRRP